MHLLARRCGQGALAPGVQGARPPVDDGGAVAVIRLPGARGRARSRTARRAPRNALHQQRSLTPAAHARARPPSAPRSPRPPRNVARPQDRWFGPGADALAKHPVSVARAVQVWFANLATQPFAVSACVPIASIEANMSLRALKAAPGLGSAARKFLSDQLRDREEDNVAPSRVRLSVRVAGCGGGRGKGRRATYSPPPPPNASRDPPRVRPLTCAPSPTPTCVPHPDL